MQNKYVYKSIQTNFKQLSQNNKLHNFHFNTGVLDADKQLIVDSHNTYRSGVSPTAAMMYKMVGSILHR